MTGVRTKGFAATACAVAVALVCASSAGAAPRAPAPSSPADGALVDAIPPLGWGHVGGAATYEFQMAADARFESIVLGQGNGSFQTRNTFATLDRTLPNGTYYWRVRSLNAKERAGRWSKARRLRKNWNNVPQLTAPANDSAIAYPLTPLVLRWNPVPGAYKYLVWIGTDPSLASVDKPIETSATVFSPAQALGPGTHYWAVTPIDAQNHRGARSAVRSFRWTWPSQTNPVVTDLNSDERVFDPEFSWDAVAGASSYQVEINFSRDFAAGSKVCCGEKVIGTSLSPKETLPNNTYYWRVRALDLDQQAGQWNEGPSFRKTFDDVAPTVPTLRMRNTTESTADDDADPGTPTVLDLYDPIVQWDPVPGASSYELQWTPYDEGVQGCDWSLGKDYKTAATAWAPLAAERNPVSPVPGAPDATIDSHDRQFVVGTRYCVRVRAVNDVVSDWTQIGGAGSPAFKHAAAPAGTVAAGSSFTMPESAYMAPAHGTFTPRLPLFTWQPIADAQSYWVVVAKDQSFTQILDLALTNRPMYAPREQRDVKTYPDETTSYYWAVVPAKNPNGGNFFSAPGQNNPRGFEKRSTPPTPLGPAAGEDVLRQPVFRWSASEGADEYELQVATDPSFSNVLHTVTTAATAYTSETTYPADTVLYWRVSANDEDGIGLTWSSTETFRRRLPAPFIFADNPTAGETIPVLRWQPVNGATSYDLHVEQADGTDKDLDLRGTAFTATQWYGTGVWHWQVRANFPTGGSSEVQGAYSGRRPFTRRVPTPSNLRAINRNRRMLLRWDPATQVKNYKVEISKTNSFSSTIDSTTTDHRAWAPKLTQSDLIAGGRFYWRVAAVDEGGNVGGWQVAKLRTARKFEIEVLGAARARTSSRIQILVRHASDNVRRAKVVVSGAGIRRRARRTGRDGVATFEVRPRRRGTLRFRVTKRGYRPAIVKTRVLRRSR